MRTNIVIVHNLIVEAIRVTARKTNREMVKLGLETLLRLGRQEPIRRLRGKLACCGDPEATRTDGWSRSIPASGSITFEGPPHRSPTS